MAVLGSVWLLCGVPAFIAWRIRRSWVELIATSVGASAVLVIANAVVPHAGSVLIAGALGLVIVSILVRLLIERFIKPPPHT